MSSRATRAVTAASTRSTTRSKTATTMPPPAPPATATVKRTTRAATTATTTIKAANKDVNDPPSTSPRKPLWSRNIGVTEPTTPRKLVPAQPQSTPRTAVKAAKTVTEPVVTDDNDKEPIKAFLRIRPKSSDEEESHPPYLSALSETTVKMFDSSPTARYRATSSEAHFTFTRVFPPNTEQGKFFVHTALPLVRDVLDGHNGLLFAYGVTNSGKTYTIQGGHRQGEAGLLPRTLDVIFNSIDSLHSDAQFRPVRLAGVEFDDAPEESRPASALSNNKRFRLTMNPDDSVLGGILADAANNVDDVDDLTLKVDRNYEYAIWVSYAEIYNEKIFDLLSDSADPSTSSNLGLPRSTSFFGTLPSNGNLAALASTPSSADLNNPLLVKRKALALKSDPDGGKYIGGLKEVRVRTREEAKAVVRIGQLNRRVFGTLANSASSRSHGIFTVKVIRVHGGLPDDPESVQTARLSIVDLAGSERTKNTNNTGERLKEAGNINNSLMVLGQCMEILRSNQRRIASAGGNVAALKMPVVPFRHSKLTELFQDFFVGNGKAVMIVNVNPYDTGFDENSHVMRFSALAREVTTVAAKRPPSGVPVPTKTPTRRQITISLGGNTGRRATEARLEIVEEDAELGTEDDDEPLDGLVEALFERLNEMREKLFEAELRAAVIESETREEVIAEMSERMAQMELMYRKRLMNEMRESSLKTDRKIDLLHQAGFIGRKPSASTSRYRETDEHDEEDIEVEIQTGLEELESDGSEDSQDLEPPPSDVDDGTSADGTPSPLAKKSRKPYPYTVVQKVRRSSVASLDTIGLPDPATEDEEASESMISSEEETAESQDDEEDTEADEDEDDDEWQPKKPTKSTRRISSESVESDMDGLAIQNGEEDDDDEGNLTKPTPRPPRRKSSGQLVSYSEDDGSDYSPRKPIAKGSKYGL